MADYLVNVIDAVVFVDEPKDINVIRDGVGFSDIPTVNVTQTVYVSDRIVLRTEPFTVFSVTVSDSVSFTDSPKTIISVTASDELRMLDASYRDIIFNVSVSDQVLFDASVTERFDYASFLTDEVSFTEGPIWVYSVYAADTLTITDTADENIYYQGTDTAVFSDQASVNVRWVAEAEDTVEFSEDLGYSIWGNASEVIRLLDWTDDTRIRKDTSDLATITDKVEVFNRYKVQCTDEFVISDYIDGDITPYIKWLYDDLIMEDDADWLVHYRARVRNNISLSDVANGRMIVHALHQENVEIDDSSWGSVYWSTPLEASTNQIVLTDSCKVFVSHKVTTVFTNALFADVGTSEQIVYTATDVDHATILNISLANTISSDITVQVILYKGGVDPINIKVDLPIGAGETFVINNKEEGNIVIEEDDEIRVLSSDASSVDVFLSVIETLGT